MNSKPDNGRATNGASEFTPASLVESYKRYLCNPCKRTIRNFIRQAIEAKEDRSLELLSPYLGAPPIPVGDRTYFSGGSSGVRTPYRVGPHLPVVRSTLERFLQAPDLDFDGQLVLYPQEFFPEHRPGKGLGLFPGGDVLIRLNHEPSARTLIERISQLQERCRKGIILYGPFSAFQSLSNFEFFLDYLRSIKDKIILSVLATDAFFNKRLYGEYGIRCNDQMVNWRSGLAFYTCSYGTRHCIKNLYAIHDGKMYNLLNFNHRGHDDISDLIETENSPCACGRGFAIKRFVPHFKLVSTYPDGRLLHDLSIIEKLDTPIHMLQFLTKGDGRLNCHYLSDYQPSRKRLEEYFGLPVDFVPQPFGTLYRKSPAYCGRPDLIREVGFNAPIQSASG